RASLRGGFVAPPSARAAPPRSIATPHERRQPGRSDRQPGAQLERGGPPVSGRCVRAAAGCCQSARRVAARAAFADRAGVLPRPDAARDCHAARDAARNRQDADAAGTAAVAQSAGAVATVERTLMPEPATLTCDEFLDLAAVVALDAADAL